MALSTNKTLLRLKGHELVQPGEDRRVELGVFEVLLPCRKYDVSYKVAVLGQVSPSLEFLLRLVKSAPGLSEDDIAAFFGYTRSETAYVLAEAEAPGYIERRNGRIWLSIAGDDLFLPGENMPLIYSVEDRRRSVGFDFLSIAPQHPRSLDQVELNLPEFRLDENNGAGSVVDRIPDRFRRFFLELADKKDREQFERRDLYSIDQDRISAGERFLVPVRISTHAAASNPAAAEIDLSGWRPENEVADRQQIEGASAVFVEELNTNGNSLGASTAYEHLISFAPAFLDDFITRTGLSINRYWRESVSRAGEVRADRKTIPLIGSMYLQENTKRLLSVVDYGLRDLKDWPTEIISIAPQIQNWGATIFQREMLTLLRQKVGQSNPGGDQTEAKTVCLFSGKPPRYVEKSFDETRMTDTAVYPAAWEMLLIPGVAVAALVHAPIGASTGYPVPLGLASFDPDVVKRAEESLADRIDRFRSIRIN